MISVSEAGEKLNKYGQGHVLSYFDSLNEREKNVLLKQIEETDFSVLLSAKNDHGEDKRVITPIKALQLGEINEKKDFYKEKGIKALREGKLGAVLLAGGMGTRLGSDDPKGMYDIGLTRHVYIFMRLIENLKEVVRLTGKPVHLFIMMMAQVF